LSVSDSPKAGIYGDPHLEIRPRLVRRDLVLCVSG
jgi:hypothetical protein